MVNSLLPIALAVALATEPRTAPDQVYNYLVVPVRFQDSAERDLFTVPQYEQMLFNANVGLDQFFLTSSMGRATIRGSVVSQSRTLPRPRTAYISKGEESAQAGPGFYSVQWMMDDLTASLSQEYDLSSYFGIALLPNRPDGNSYSSAQTPMVKLDGISDRRKLNVLYLSGHGLPGFAHEIGHHIGIGHVMTERPGLQQGANAMSFVGARDPIAVSLTADYLMWHKALLGWTAKEEVRECREVGTHEFRLYARGHKERNLKLLKVPLTRLGTYLIAEAVLPQGIDRIAGLKETGVVLTRVDELNVTRSNLGIFPEGILPTSLVSKTGTAFHGPGSVIQVPDTEGAIEVKRVTTEYVDIIVRNKVVPAHMAHKDIPDRIEAESLKRTTTMYSAFVQDMSKFTNAKWSGQKQVLMFGMPGEYTDFQFDVLQAGSYDLILGHTYASDFGHIEILINGIPAKKVKCFLPVASPSGGQPLGRHELKAKGNALRVRFIEKLPESLGERAGAGIDCLGVKQAL